MSDKKQTKPRNPFVHHLIPIAAAAAGLTFTGCPPSAEDPDDMGSGAMMDMGPANNVTPGNNTSSPDMNAPSNGVGNTSPSPMDMGTDEDQGTPDPVDMGMDEDQGTPDPVDMGGQDQGTPDPADMGEETDQGAPADMGEFMATIKLDEASVRTFCQDWNACDAMEFSDYFADVDECTTTNLDSINGYLSDYEQYYGVSCAQANLDFYNAAFAAYKCEQGTFTYDEAAFDAAYATFEAKYMMYCQP